MHTQMKRRRSAVGFTDSRRHSLCWRNLCKSYEESIYSFFIFWSESANSVIINRTSVSCIDAENNRNSLWRDESINGKFRHCISIAPDKTHRKDNNGRTPNYHEHFRKQQRGDGRTFIWVHFVRCKLSQLKILGMTKCEFNALRSNTNTHKHFESCWLE